MPDRTICNQTPKRKMSPRSKPRVLIVDDNKADSGLFAYGFSNTGVPHEVDGAQDGQSAMDCLRQRLRTGDLPLPRLILLDLTMPKMSGIEFLRELKANEQLRRIPVIVMTSSQFARDIDEAYEAGACLYVCKPNDLESLEELIRAIATVWLKYGTPPEILVHAYKAISAEPSSAHSTSAVVSDRGPSEVESLLSGA